MINYEEEYLAHHGTKGQRWGVRRFQNSDGSLTAAGKMRYSVGNGGRYISKKVDLKSAAKLKKLQVKEEAKLERLKIKESAKNERYKEKLDKKKSHITNKEYVKTLSDEKLKAINNRDIAEKLWLKNNPEKKTVGRYIADDLLKPAFNKAMTEQVNNYISKFVNYSTKKVVDSILNSPDFKEKSRKK